MAPYATDTPQMQTGSYPVAIGQQTTGAYQINGVTYFTTPQPIPTQIGTTAAKDLSDQPVFANVPMQMYASAPVSSRYNTPVPAPSQDGDQVPGSPGQHSPIPVEFATTYQAPPTAHTQVVYTTAPSMMVQPQQHHQPQMVQFIQFPMYPAAATVPGYGFVPIQQYSPTSSVQYSPSAFSTPMSGLSPAPPSTPVSGSRASTPASAGYQGEHRPTESLSTRLEVVWHGGFDNTFRSYPHKWNLAPVADPRAVESSQEGIHSFMDSAKVRFSCPNCNNCWTSMKGRVYFLYLLDPVAGEGYVYFTLLGQKCSFCPEDYDYVHSMWYPDEIEKVIANIHQKVGQTYYGVRAPIVRVDRRQGQPKKPHSSKSCQACELGICREERNFR